MKVKLWGFVAGSLLFASGLPARATTYTVTFDNVLIDNNPNYTVSGSFIYDTTQLESPSALYGLSDFNVLAVTPYGTFQMNTVWSVDSAFDYIGLETGTCCSSSTPALMLVFASNSNGNGTGLNLLNQAAIDGVPLTLITNGQSDFIPGRSVLVPSVTELYSINYSGYGHGNWPAASNAFLTVSGSLDASITPLPASLPLFATGLGALGLFGCRGKRNTASVPERLS